MGEEKEIWIRERLHPDFEHATRATRLLYEKKSRYQLIQVYETNLYGRMLVLDGAVQTTEKDQHYYHEMIVDLPVLLADSCEKVLIIGGGDGGALRAALDHNVKEVWLVELDEEVIKVSQEFLPEISRGAFNDPRTRVIVMDGFLFLKDKHGFFDLIIVDSPDPVGEAEKLYSDEFYSLLKRALKNGGVVAGQAGSPWLQPGLCHTIKKGLEKHFKHVNFYTGFVPSYPGTYWLYYLATDAFNPKESAARRFAGGSVQGSHQYYFLNADYIQGCFSLPEWVRRTLETGEW